MDRQVECPVPHEGIGSRITPAIGHGLPHRIRQSHERCLILLKRQHDLRRATGACVGDAFGHESYECSAVTRRVARHIARVRQSAKYGSGAFRRIQSNAIADPAIPVGIVGQDQGDAAVMGRFTA